MPRMIELIRTSAVPSTLMHSAAKGALAVPPAEMIEILVYLATENRIFKEQARMTLAGWDEAASREVAGNPATPKEVLDYMTAPQNLRPALLPRLLENPSILDSAWVEFAVTASRTNIEMMLASKRVGKSPSILKSLAKNPALTATQSESVREKLQADNEVAASPEPVEPAAEDAPAQAVEASEPDPEADEQLAKFLTEHSKELSTEAEKPFQPMGGTYEELIASDEDEPEKEPEAEVKTEAAKKPAAKKPADNQQKQSTLQKISALDIKGRIQLAMKGTKEERSLLVRDGTKLVALAVLESPKISDGEVEKIASQKNVLEAVLRAIPMKRRFAKLYPVTRNLVANPRTPLDVSLNLMKYILVNDLKSLSGNKEVSETVRKLALKLFKQKTDVGKKNH